MDGFEKFLVALICFGVTLVAFVFSVIFYHVGFEKGYTTALDDIRLGKPAKYKLVQAAEKWVEVEK